MPRPLTEPRGVHVAARGDREDPGDATGCGPNGIQLGGQLGHPRAQGGHLVLELEDAGDARQGHTFVLGEPLHLAQQVQQRAAVVVAATAAPGGQR